MQHIVSVIDVLISVIMVITPFVVPLWLKQKGYVTNLFLSSVLSLMVSALLIFLFGYWSDLSVNLRLTDLGFDFEGLSDQERLRKVAPALRDEALKLYQSRMGIGWPLKAIFGTIFFIPYQIAASGLVFLVRYLNKRGQIP